MKIFPSFRKDLYKYVYIKFLYRVHECSLALLIDFAIFQEKRS